MIGLALVLTVSLHAQSTWQNIGPNGGLVDALAADVKNPGVLYCGTNTGEIYKTIDDGQSWSFLTKLPSFVTRMMIDTVNGNRIIVATSEGMYYSLNGGATFSASATSDLEGIFDLAISPLNAVQMIAVSGEAVYRSNNSGQSWSAILEVDDTTEVTAFGFNPQDPQNTYYWATTTDNGLSRIFRTANGGANVITVHVLPLNWQTRKVYVSSDPLSTVMVMIGNDDSTRILRSINNGGTWVTVYESDIPLFDEFTRPYAFSWLPRPGNDMEQVIAWNGGFLRTNNRGLNWSALGSLPRAYTTLVRSASDTTKFYGRIIGENGLSKVILTTYGDLSVTDINDGLTATAIRRLLYADGDKIIAQSEFNDLVVSQNGGFDFKKFGLQGNQVVTAYKSEFDDLYYWIYENGKVYRSNGITATLYDSVPFTLGLDKVIDAKFVTYYDPVSDADSGAMIVAIGKNGNPQGDILMSVDDGQNWTSLNYDNVFGANPYLHTISVEENPELTVIVATEQSIWKLDARYENSWSQVFTAPGTSTIVNMVSRFHTVLVYLDDGTLQVGFFEFFSGTWEFYDVTWTLESIMTPGSEIKGFFAGEDGFYLLIDNEGGSRKLYKTSFAVHRWVDITESPLDVLNVKSMGDDFDFEDQEAILYVGANNGIWKLNQSAVLSHDTVAVSVPASLNLGSPSPLIVNYRNDGTLFIQIDSFRIAGSSGAFQIADSNLADPTKYQPFGIDIKSTTPLEILFTPTGLGAPQAFLNAYYSGQSSRGGDSLFTRTTRLVGSVKASQINTGLKGDTLSFAGALLGSTDIGSFMLRNSGSDTMHVSALTMANGKYFTLTSTDADGNVLNELTLAPGKSQMLSFSFIPDSAGFFSDSLIITGSAHNFTINEPDSQHVVYLVGVGSGVAVDNIGSLTALLNQDLKITVSLAGLQASEVSGKMFYRQTGEFTYKEKSLTPDAGLPVVAKLSASIPAEDVTEKGIEFVIEVQSTDGVVSYFPDAFAETGQPFGLGVTVRSPGLSSTGSVSLPGGTSAKAYQLISFPLKLDNRTVAGAFSSSNLGTIGDRGDWQLYRYDAAGEGFIRATDNNVTFGEIQHGKSYLLITRTAKTLNSGDGKSVTQDEAITTIEPGWNMIANPFAFSIPWVVVNYFNTGLQFTNLVVLNNGRFRYVDDFDLTSMKLEPWKGYMYYSEPDSGTFTIFYPAISSSAAGFTKFARRNLAADHLQENEFVATLTLDENGIVSHHAFGQLSDASDGTDGYDRRELPSVDPQEVKLTFEASDRRLHSDFRGISTDGQYWDLTLHVAEGKNSITLTMPETDLPPDFSVRIFDRDNAKVYASGESISLSVTAGRPRHLRILVGTASYMARVASETVPTSFSLSQNYPNPFNPVTTIRYALPQTARVRLSVYNTLGQHVATLVDGVQPAAFHSVQWNGRSANGGAVASGVYIYRIEAEAIEGRQRMVLSRKMIIVK
jgi:photosystem II stability/assembly factor-like uncharacterized protein